MAAIKIERPAKAPPVTLSQAKSHCRVSIPDDDDLISLYVDAATTDVEGFLARSLVNKGFRQSLDSFPYYTDSTQSQLAYPPSYYALPRYSTTLWNYSQMIKLFYSPLVAVDRISYMSSADSAWHDLLPAPIPWQPRIRYALGDQREDVNGNLQEVTAVARDATSGDGPAAWGTTEGDETTDRALVWTCRGVAPAGDFVFDADSEPPRVFPMPGQNWPSVLYVPNAVQLHYTAGYGDDAADVPGLAKLGILHSVDAYYENRSPICAGSPKELPPPIQNLLWSLRVLDFAPTRG
jgi:hypothetical protein